MLFGIIKFLWKLFVVGFKPDCEHEFEPWKDVNTYSYTWSDKHGSYTKNFLKQERRCKKCNICKTKDTLL